MDEMRVVRFPVLDTGIGQAMGYANDAEFVAAAEAEREATLSLLTPETRARFEEAEAEADRRFLLGG